MASSIFDLGLSCCGGVGSSSGLAFSLGLSSKSGRAGPVAAFKGQSAARRKPIVARVVSAAAELRKAHARPAGGRLKALPRTVYSPDLLCGSKLEAVHSATLPDMLCTPHGDSS